MSPLPKIAALRWPKPVVIVDEAKKTHTTEPEFRITSSTLSMFRSRSATTLISTHDSSPPTIHDSTLNLPRSTPTTNGDMGIAIIVGLILGITAIATAASLFWLIWRRQKHTGSYFKKARSSVCIVDDESFMSPADSSRGGAQYGLESKKPTRRLSATKTEFFDAKLVNDVEKSIGSLPKAYIPHQAAQTLNVHYSSIHGRGPTRLQKSHSVLNGGRVLAELVDPSGLIQPHELAGDDLVAISEMGVCTPMQNVSSLEGETNPFILATPAEAEAAVDQRVNNGNQQPPHHEHAIVATINCMECYELPGDECYQEQPSDDDCPDLSSGDDGHEISSGDERYELSSGDKRDGNCVDNDSIAENAFSATPAIPEIRTTEVTLPDSADISPITTPFGSSRAPSLREAKGKFRPSPLPRAATRHVRGNTPYSPVYALWRQRRRPSPIITGDGIPSPTIPALRYDDNLTVSRSRSSSRYASFDEDRRVSVSPGRVHYPSYSEISEFDFAGAVQVRRNAGDFARNGDGDDGWRPVPDSAIGRYELAT